jgi:hypothetical protein
VFKSQYNYNNKKAKGTAKAKAWMQSTQLDNQMPWAARERGKTRMHGCETVVTKTLAGDRLKEKETLGEGRYEDTNVIFGILL